MTEERILELLEIRDYKQLKSELEDMYPVDIADLMGECNEKQMIIIFRLLGKEDAAETFTYMNSDMREVLLEALTDSEVEEVMEEMYVDDTVDVLEEMPAEVWWTDFLWRRMRKREHRSISFCIIRRIVREAL